MTKVEKLKNIIQMYDQLMGFWLVGMRPQDLEEDFGCVYKLSDELRNEGLEIVKDLEKVLDTLQ